MKNKNKKPLLGVKKNKKWTVYPLLVVLMGIFLLPKTAYFSSITEEKIIELTNIERVKIGINQVSASQLLTKAAYDKAGALLRAQKFQHDIDGKTFSTWVKEAGYEYSYVGENLAIDFITSEGAMNAWLDSPTHKKNILNNKFTEIGVAIVEGNFQNQNTTLVVQIFGTPLAVPNTDWADLKNPENNLPELSLDRENLLTNAAASSFAPEILNSDMEIYNPKDYLTVLKINPAQASARDYSPFESGKGIWVLYSLLVSGLIFSLYSIKYYIDYCRSLAHKNIS